MRKHLKRFKTFFLNLLFPVECLSCKKEGEWLCKECLKKIAINSSQYCLHCKKNNKFGEFCCECGKKYFLNGILIAGNYEDEKLSTLIKNLKYRFIKEIAEILGNFLFLFLKKINAQNDNQKIFFNIHNTIIIPVPLHKKRKKWRGFNQSEEIAKMISLNLNIKISKDLIRTKNKTPQAKLKEIERKKNIQECFKWTGKNLNNKNIILVDDVTTTGSTLNECAKTLESSGAGKIWGLVVAKG